MERDRDRQLCRIEAHVKEVQKFRCGSKVLEQHIVKGIEAGLRQSDSDVEEGVYI